MVVAAGGRRRRRCLTAPAAPEVPARHHRRCFDGVSLSCLSLSLSSCPSSLPPLPPPGGERGDGGIQSGAKVLPAAAAAIVAKF